MGGFPYEDRFQELSELEKTGTLTDDEVAELADLNTLRNAYLNHAEKFADAWVERGELDAGVKNLEAMLQEVGPR